MIQYTDVWGVEIVHDAVRDAAGLRDDVQGGDEGGASSGVTGNSRACL